MKGWLNRLHFRPWLMPAFLLGVLAGVILSFVLSILPFDSASIANIIGAGLGAALTTAGAAWLVNGPQRRNEAAARRAITNVVVQAEFLTARLLKTTTDVSVDPTDAQFRQVEAAANALIEACTLMHDRVQNLGSVFEILGPAGVESRLDLLRRIPYLRNAAEQSKHAACVAGEAGEIQRQQNRARLRSDAISILGHVGMTLREHHSG